MSGSGTPAGSSAATQDVEQSLAREVDRVGSPRLQERISTLDHRRERPLIEVHDLRLVASPRPDRLIERRDLALPRLLVDGLESTWSNGQHVDIALGSSLPAREGSKQAHMKCRHSPCLDGRDNPREQFLARVCELDDGGCSDMVSIEPIERVARWRVSNDDPLPDETSKHLADPFVAGVTHAPMDLCRGAWSRRGHEHLQHAGIERRRHGRKGVGQVHTRDCANNIWLRSRIVAMVERESCVWVRASRDSVAGVSAKVSRAARYARRRKRRMAQVAHDLTPDQWTAIRAAWGGCAYCHAVDQPLQRDCVLPIAHGGRYTLANVVPACPSCNASKCESEVGLWLRRKRLDERAFLTRFTEVTRTLLDPAAPTEDVVRKPTS